MEAMPVKAPSLNSDNAIVEESNAVATTSTREKRKEEALEEGDKNGVKPKGHEEQADTYGLYDDNRYQSSTEGGIQTYRDDQYTSESKIDDVNDFTLAMYLMQNKVSL